MLKVDYFNPDAWINNTDPRLVDFPFMSSSPTHFLSIVIAYAIIAKSSSWTSLLNSKNIDLSPYLLIQNGFFFGIHGAGLALTILIHNLYSTTDKPTAFDCSPLIVPKPDQGFEHIRSESLIHLVYILIWVRVAMFSEVFVLLSVNHKAVSISRILNDMFSVMIFYCGARYMPGGLCFFFAIWYFIYYTFSYGYWTLKSAKLTNYGLETRARAIQLALQFTWALGLVAHHLFIVNNCPKNSKLQILATCEAFYGLALFASAAIATKKFLKQKR